MLKCITISGIQGVDGKKVISATVEHDDGIKEVFDGKEAEKYDYLVKCHVAIQAASAAFKDE